MTIETTLHSKIVVLTPENNKHLLNLCGQWDEHIRLIEDRLDVHIKQRAFTFSISGQELEVDKACLALTDLYQKAQKDRFLTPYQVHLYLQTIGKKNTVQNTHTSPGTKRVKLIPFTSFNTSMACIKPESRLFGKSICDISPVITALELKPKRVKNIFICSAVIF